jgi:hypothetical protein
MTRDHCGAGAGGHLCSGAAAWWRNRLDAYLLARGGLLVNASYLRRLPGRADAGIYLFGRLPDRLRALLVYAAVGWASRSSPAPPALCCTASGTCWWWAPPAAAVARRRLRGGAGAVHAAHPPRGCLPLIATPRGAGAPVSHQPAVRVQRARGSLGRWPAAAAAEAGRARLHLCGVLLSVAAALRCLPALRGGPSRRLPETPRSAAPAPRERIPSGCCGSRHHQRRVVLERRCLDADGLLLPRQQDLCTSRSAHACWCSGLRKLAVQCAPGQLGPGSRASGWRGGGRRAVLLSGAASAWWVERQRAGRTWPATASWCSGSARRCSAGAHDGHASVPLSPGTDRLPADRGGSPGVRRRLLSLQHRGLGGGLAAGGF